MAPQPMQEPTKRSTRVTRQSTQQSFTPFTSNTVEARALVNELVDYLTKNTHRGQLSEDAWAQWNNEILQIKEDISNRRTSYSDALPKLHQIAEEWKYPGARKSQKGNWIYSQAVHAKNTLERQDRVETSTPTHRNSPDLLATDNDTQNSELSDINLTPPKE